MLTLDKPILSFIIPASRVLPGSTGNKIDEEVRKYADLRV
jgi:hypothetical protein